MLLLLNQNTCQTAAAVEGTANTVLEVIKITYRISIYTAAQMKKDAGKHGAAKDTFLQLKSTEPWDTVKAQLLVKIDSILKPTTINFDNYTFSFSVPQVHTKPTDLTNEDSYRFMIKHTCKGKEPAVNLTIEPKLHSRKVW